jgi:hypothetical protein
MTATISAYPPFQSLPLDLLLFPQDPQKAQRDEDLINQSTRTWSNRVHASSDINSATNTVKRQPLTDFIDISDPTYKILNETDTVQEVHTHFASTSDAPTQRIPPIILKRVAARSRLNYIFSNSHQFQFHQAFTHVSFWRATAYIGINQPRPKLEEPQLVTEVPVQFAHNFGEFPCQEVFFHHTKSSNRFAPGFAFASAPGQELETLQVPSYSNQRRKWISNLKEHKAKIKARQYYKHKRSVQTYKALLASQQCQQVDPARAFHFTPASAVNYDSCYDPDITYDPAYDSDEA